MNRKKLVIMGCTAVAIAALVFAAINGKYVDFAGSGDNAAESTDNIPAGNNQDESQTAETSVTVGSDLMSTGTEPTVPVSETSNTEPLQSESIPVDENSAEYDLNAALLENADQTTILKLEYYMNGASVTREIPEADLPELGGMFEKRANQEENEDGYRIGQLLLNARYEKAYVTVITSSLKDMESTFLYEINLSDGKLKKIGGLYGKSGGLQFNKSGKYLAFSYKNPPTDSSHIESELFDVLNCSTGEYAVRFARDLKGKPIGTNSAEGLLSDYRIKAWKTEAILLLEKTPVKSDGKPASKETKTIEVLYDMAKNLLLNSDGTALQPEPAKTTGNTAAATTASAVITGDESLQILKNFYSYLGEPENYSKAMKLLDDGFYLEIDLLKQFGVDKVLKKDIDAENASIYREILKAAKLDMVVQVKEGKNTSQIYYYQTLSLNEDSQAKQALFMQLKITSSGWKIALIQEQDATKVPFAE